MPDHWTTSQLLLRELERMAADTFETSEDAAGWLRRPHPLLDKKTPLEMARTEAGAKTVKSMLIGLKFGGVA